SSGYALEVASLTSGTTLEDLEFDAQPANPANLGESSVAGFIHGSQNVTLTRVALVAGAGSNGAAGASAGPPGATNWGATGGRNGSSATSSAPGGATICVCAIDTTHGSSGGQGGSLSQVPGGG